MRHRLRHSSIRDAIDRAEMAVDAAQQRDQRFALRFIETIQQSGLARQCDGDDAIVGRAAFDSQRDRMAAAILRVAVDRDQAALAQQRQRAADRALVQSDDVADARRRYARLDRQQREDAPFRDVDAEARLIERGGAATACWR